MKETPLIWSWTIGESDSEADVNGDGSVDILDLVQVVNHI